MLNLKLNHACSALCMMQNLKNSAHFFGTKSKTGGVSFHFCNAYNYIVPLSRHIINIVLILSTLLALYNK